MSNGSRITNLDNIDVYKTRSEFNYDRWTENVVIKLCNIAWNDSDDAVYFESDEKRNEYFKNIKGLELDKNNFLNTANTVNLAQTVRVPVPFQNLTYNYLAVFSITPPLVNESIESNEIRDRFYFITDAKQISPSVTELTLKLDTWTTFQSHISFRLAHYLRGHYKTDDVTVDDLFSGNSDRLELDINNLEEPIKVNHRKVGESKIVNLAKGDPIICLMTQTLLDGTTWENADGTAAIPYISKTGIPGGMLSQPMTYAIYPKDWNKFCSTVKLQFWKTVKGAFYVDSSWVEFNADIKFGTGDNAITIHTLNITDSGLNKIIENINFTKADYGYESEFAKAYTQQFAPIDIYKGSEYIGSIGIENFNTLKVGLSSNVVYPMIKVEAMLTGLNANGSKMFSFKRLDQDINETYENGDWRQSLFDLKIPVFAIAENPLDNWDYEHSASNAQAYLNRDIDKRIAYRNADTAKQNGLNSANTAKTNADASVNTSATNTAASIATAKTSGDASVNTSAENQAASIATTKTNADASVNTAQANGNASAATGKANAVAAAETAKENATASNDTGNANANRSIQNTKHVNDQNKEFTYSMTNKSIDYGNDVKDIQQKYNNRQMDNQKSYLTSDYNYNQSAYAVEIAAGMGAKGLSTISSIVNSNAQVNNATASANDKESAKPAQADADTSSSVSLSDGGNYSGGGSTPGGDTVAFAAWALQMTTQVALALNRLSHDYTIGQTKISDAKSVYNSQTDELQDKTTTFNKAQNDATKDNQTEIIDSNFDTSNQNQAASYATTTANINRTYSTSVGNANRSYSTSVANNNRSASTGLANNKRSFDTGNANNSRSQATGLANNQRSFDTGNANNTRSRDTGLANNQRSYDTSVTNTNRSYDTAIANADDNYNRVASNIAYSRSAAAVAGMIDRGVNGGDHFSYGTGRFFYQFIIRKPDTKSVTLINSMFNNYGYTWNEFLTNLTHDKFKPNREFNYWKMSEMKLNPSDIMNVYLNDIKAKFEHGIRIWRAETI